MLQLLTHRQRPQKRAPDFTVAMSKAPPTAVPHKAPALEIDHVIGPTEFNKLTERAEGICMDAHDLTEIVFTLLYYQERGHP